MRWVQFSGEVECLRVINGLLQQLREKDAIDFGGVQSCPCILPRPITSWYMFHGSKDWEEDALFEISARSSLRTTHKTPASRLEPVMDPGMLARWQDVAMYNIPVSTLRKLYITLMVNVVRH